MILECLMVTKVQMRHPTMRFNFTPPGEVFETTPECVNRLVNVYGCEVVGESPRPKAKPKPPPEITVEVKIEGAEEAIEKIKELNDAIPIQTSPGWWLYDGKKYRRAKLPAEAAALLE